MHQSTTSFFQLNHPASAARGVGPSSKSSFLSLNSAHHHHNSQMAAKFANLFPNITPNAMAAAVSSLNPFSIESLLAPSQRNNLAVPGLNGAQQKTAGASNFASTLAGPSPTDLYGTFFSLFF